MGNAIFFEPAGIELKSVTLILCSAIFISRGFSPNDKRYFEFRSNGQGNVEYGQVHRNSGGSIALEREQDEFLFDVGVDLIINVIDAQMDEVCKITVSNFSASRRLPG